MNVRYTRRAQRDLAKILDPIERFPHCGYRAGHANAMGLAVTPYPYIVYWIVDGSDAQIVHIRHAARRVWKEER